MQMRVVHFAPLTRSLFPYDKTDKPFYYIAPELFTVMLTNEILPYLVRYYFMLVVTHPNNYSQQQL